MKKLFTLVLALGCLSTVFAQGRRQDNDNRNRDYTYNNPSPRGSGYDDRGGYKNRYDESYSFTNNQRDEFIRRINFDYDQRIVSIQRDRFLRASQKDKQIRKLEKERRREIENVLNRYDNNKNKYNDKYYDRNFNWKH